MADFERAQSPEERELDLKRTELAGLESELVERELELSTLQQELAVFEAEYRCVVGRRYAALDDINARIAEAQAVRRPDDQASLEEARNARETADVSVAQAGGDVPDAETAPRFEPPTGLKALYRAAARKLHPDLATTDGDRARRHEWMAKVNEAYRQEKEDALNTVLADWETSPESVPGTDIPSELVRVIRQIAQVRRRIDEIGLVIDALKAGDLYALHAQCRTQPRSADNPIDELAAWIDEQIADAKRRLENLKAESRTPDVLESRNDGDTDIGDAETNGGGAPLEERYEEIQQLILLGKQRGYLLFDEVNELLPAEITSSEELDGLFDLFGNAGIRVVESRQEREETERTERTERDERADDVADWYIRAVEHGHADAQFRLGNTLANGIGVQQDVEEAVKWYRQAAKQGHVHAQNELAGLYRRGEGVPQNYTEAAVWYRRAADQGDPTAQSNLGLMYNHGLGVSQDYLEAVTWYRRAADQGDPAGQVKLGTMYTAGQGVRRDYRVAAGWYRRAADQGDASAQYLLGMMHEAGHGVPRHTDTAMQWYRCAADQGHTDAQQRLACLETQLDEPGIPDIRTEGQQERGSELGWLGYFVVKLGSVLAQYGYLFLIALVGLASAYGGVYTAEWLSTILCDEVCGVAGGLAVVGGFFGGWLTAMAVLGGALAVFRELVRAFLSR